jgi:Uma2 family endonuclease
MILSGISWATYESLLADHIDRGPRFAYDRGLLEIMTTSAEHEREVLALAMVVEVVAIELELDIDPVGSTTFKRPDLEQGFEPDASFYIHHRDQVSTRAQIDLATDPPPDVVIEVDITNSSLDRFPIYAGMGVPEVWRYAKGSVTISLLQEGTFVDSTTSAALPFVTAEALTRFLEERRKMPRVAWVRAIQTWVREQRAKSASG